MINLLFTMLFFCATISGMRTETDLINGFKKRKFEELINFTEQEKKCIDLFIKEREHSLLDKKFLEIGYECSDIIEFKHQMLVKAVVFDNLPVAEALTHHGARADYVFKSGKQEVLDVCQFGDPRFIFLSLFVRRGLDPNTILPRITLSPKHYTLFEWAMLKLQLKLVKSTVTVDSPLANTLLYYGAEIKQAKSYSNLDKNFIQHAHARRVHRLACYLRRCTRLPSDITGIISTVRYGPLSEHDKELMKHYLITDYAKQRNYVV